MKKVSLYVAAIMLMATACRTLTSTTTIQPNNSFVLGNNEHGTFSARLKNISNNNIVVHLAPIAGGTHSYVTVKPRETVNVSVDKNTALIVGNNNNEVANVELKVIGDTGLSMGYKN